MNPTRTLCSECFQSFEAIEQGTVCEACRDRVAAREQRSADEGSREFHVVESSLPAPDGFWARQRAAAAEWCRGRLWWARLPLWVYFVYVLSRHCFGSEPYRSIFDAINLGIHELGHVIFRPFGDFLMVAGGTITQCAAPIAAAVVFLRQRDYFAISVSCCWLASNFWGVAVYAGDARALQLPLVAPGMGLMPSGDGSILHDWNVMLGEAGLLRHDGTIAFLFQSAAVLTMLVGLAFGAWLMWRMHRDDARTT